MFERVPRSAPHRTAAIVTLGCRLNQADAAIMTASLEAHGFEVVPWGNPADVIVINTCTVTGVAAAKSRKAIRAARRRFPDAFIVAAGCAVDVAPDEAAESARRLGCDLVIGNAAKQDIGALLPPELKARASTQGALKVVAAGSPPESRDATFTIPLTGRHPFRTRSHLKVQEGCDACCTYCIVPKARGAPRSRVLSDAVREARELLARGYRELVVTGVNLSLYRDGESDLADLLEALCSLDGDYRIRLSSVEYWPGIRRVLDVMEQSPRLCRFLHVPLQHGSDRILEAMGRRMRSAEFADLVCEAVDRIPGVCVGTDVICGFPGEDEEAFAATVDLLERLPATYLHVFPFSPRPGTPAASLPGRVAGTVAAERTATLRALSVAKSERFARRFVGRIVRVLTEGRGKRRCMGGWSDNYLDVEWDAKEGGAGVNQFVDVRITDVVQGRKVRGTPVTSRKRR